MRILVLDSGKFKSFSCLFDAVLPTTEYWKPSTDRPYLTTVLQKHQPESKRNSRNAPCRVPIAESRRVASTSFSSGGG